MPAHIYLAIIAVVAVIPVLALTFGNSANPRRSAVMTSDGDARSIQLSRGRYERLVSPILDGLSDRLGSLAPASFIYKLERRLALAGMTNTWSTGRLIATKSVLGIAGGMLGLWYFMSGPSFWRLLSAGALFLLGFMGLDLNINSKGSDRQKLIQRELPDLLDQITISVEAGLGFDAALDRVSKDSGGMLAQEIGRVLQDIQLGVNREDALENLLERTEAPDLKQFVVALNQASKLGMPLGKILRVQASELRARRKARAEEMAYKLGVKLSFPTVTCILPALLIVVMGPAILEVMDGGLSAN